VLAFSDLQADLAAELVRRGIQVFTFNQRSVDEILQMIRVLGGIVGCQDAAVGLATEYESTLDAMRQATAAWTHRPRVFFEEWDNPLISGIQWVEELVTIAGGDPIFPELAGARLAKERVVDPAEVARRDPEIIVASWCGKRFVKSTVTGRAGWEHVSAIRYDRLYDVPSSEILQPGPASLTDGVRRLHDIFKTFDRQ
jgi:iron complex transport system substrate-binding protein